MLAANGPVFCAGADLKEGISLSGERPSSRIIAALLETPLFVVATVEAGVYGSGVSVLATCPVVLATGAARVGFPEIKQGFFPIGVVPYVDHGVPSRRLIDLGMNGSSIDALEAQRFGIFSEVVEEEEGSLQARSLKWMELVAAHPQAATQAKAYWTRDLRSENFQRRVQELEALIDVRQPTAVGQP